ncbi:cyclin-dependent kinase inhibitor 2c-related [Anaeramoeba ignava]|uniref:Cyclin-dependent kinase inhibitor 2c-related n=1 Tax=Anaeramoeba ignava TaxID=1746090 RepID=A0A9Q0LJU9_ANAIG|nr:cyclin-dependent kinase inhibitor 2c-related [Anaeramoeba ignava]
MDIYNSFVEAERTTESFHLANVPRIISQAKKGRNGNILHLYSYRNKADKLETALKTKKHNVNLRDKMGNTALHTACLCGSLEVVKLLLDYGADFSILNSKGEAPLDLALFTNSNEIKKYLLDKNSPSKANIPVLNMEIIKGNEEKAIELINSGCDITKKDNYLNSPIHEAASFGRFSCLQILLKRGVLFDEKNVGGRTPFYLSVLGRFYECCEILIKYGADINTTNIYQYTPIHLASEPKWDISFMKLLIFHKANVNAKDNEDSTPLHLAQSVEKIRLLAENGANIHARDFAEMTPLHVIAKHGKLDCLMELINYGADVTAVQELDYTAIHISAKNGRDKCLAYLLDVWEKRGLDLAFPDNYFKKTPLYLAIEHNHPKCLQVLLSKINLDSYLKFHGSSLDKKKKSLLLCASLFNSPESAYILLNNGYPRPLLSKKESLKMNNQFKLVYFDDWTFVQDFLWLLSEKNSFSESILDTFSFPKNQKEKHFSKFNLNSAILQERLGSERSQKFLHLCKEEPIDPIVIQVFLQFVYTGTLFRHKLSKKKMEKLKKFSQQLNYESILKMLESTMIYDKDSFCENMKNLFENTKDETRNFEIVVSSQNQNQNQNQNPNQNQNQNQKYTIKVHRDILAARSELFRGMFFSVNDPAKSAPDLSGRSYQAVYELIRFIYTDEIQSKDPYVLIDLLDASEYYGLSSQTRIMEQCVSKIKNVFIRFISNEQLLSELKSKAEQFQIIELLDFIDEKSEIEKRQFQFKLN